MTVSKSKLKPGFWKIDFLEKTTGDIIHFIDALQADIGTKWLAEKIMNYQPRSDPNVISKRASRSKDLKEMSIAELKEFLKLHFEKNGLPVEVLNTLVKQHISGKIFITMTDADIEKVLPTATFGIRHSLSTLIAEASLRTVNFMKENLRQFDTNVTPTLKYTKGNCVDTFVNAKGKTTEPIRNFHLVLDSNKDKALEFIACKIVPFILACLNGRRNGTIYFGISPNGDVTFKQGEIVGVNLSEEKVIDVSRESIESSFIEIQKGILKNTVREVKCVPVLNNENKVFVFELDIVPSTKVFKEGMTIRTIMNPFSSGKKNKGKDSSVFMFSDEGIPKQLSAVELCHHEKNLTSICELRQREEKMFYQPTQNLRLKLQNLLTGGRDQMQDARFTFLLTDALNYQMKSDDVLPWVSFIQHLKPRVVFDFDENSASSGLLKKCEELFKGRTRVITTDNFKGNLKNEGYVQFLSTLLDEAQIRWMFSNGYQELAIHSMDQLTWNMERSSAFQKALTFFLNNYEKNRIMFIILLFSDKYNSLIEACEEVLKKLPKRWILLAETEQAAQIWQEELLNRKKASSRDIKEKCVVGLSWKQVNKIISSITSENFDNQGYNCEIPSSNGTFVVISDETKNQWLDIEVLSSYDLALNIPKEKREKESKKVQENFYSGHEVDWLNFSFTDQVLKRRQHRDVLTNVREALHCRGNIEEELPVITIRHQPGAGGTTFAKQVLWDLRCEFRCCVVQRYTELTCNYIYELWRFEEENPKPVLVLVDNDEHFEELKESIEEKRKENSEYEFSKFYCVIIHCVRDLSIPDSAGVNEVALVQELSDEEQDWFKAKYGTLQDSFQGNPLDNKDPDFMIAFNMLKENFKEDFINQVVKRFTKSITLDVEKKLLKFISFLNTHDPNFSSIPVSCFDSLLAELLTEEQRCSSSTTTVYWDDLLSESVKVMLNLSRRRGREEGGNKYIRVCSRIIAQKILTRVKEETKEVDSAIMLEILDEEKFQSPTQDNKLLLLVLNDIFRTRKFDANSNFRRPFSEFISFVASNESSESAARLLERLYRCDNSGVIAQLIARFYIAILEWKKAEHYAILAINASKENSYFWDTLGRVYKCQISDHMFYKMNDRKTMQLNETVIHEIIRLAINGWNAFRYGQSIHNPKKINFAVNFGEIRIVLFLLNVLSYYMDEKVFQRYIVDPEYNPVELKFLTKDESSFLKKLESHSMATIRYLDSHLLELETLHTFSENFENNKNDIFQFFGESSKEIPSHYQNRQICDYRWRRARSLGALSFQSVLALKLAGSNEKLLEIFQLIKSNMSECRNLVDVKGMLQIVTVFILERRSLPDISFQNILQWTKKLYETEKGLTGQILDLEIYLFYVAFNFPTPERSPHHLAFETDLFKAIREWSQASEKHFPKNAYNRKETIVLFLRIGNPLEDILFFDKSYVLQLYNNIEQSPRPQFRNGLRIFNSILNEGGRSVRLGIQNFTLTINTAYTVRRKDMFQKNVFFYIGFSLSGPRAYGMCSTYPQYHEPISNVSTKPPMSENTQTSHSLNTLISQFFSIRDQIQGKELSDDDKKMLTLKEEDLQHKTRMITGEQTNISIDKRSTNLI
ncbi:hypothetical protein Btru_007280 [Bulinus truncatus]|nr:hypothetical protein Btru_007280 [Bulinus truncatus]